MTDPVNGCRYCGKGRRSHAQEQHAGRPGFEAWVEPTDEQRKERLQVRAATPARRSDQRGGVTTWQVRMIFRIAMDEYESMSGADANALFDAWLTSLAASPADADCTICATGTWGSGEGGHAGGWREAMRFAHHAHAEHTYRGHMSANGVLGAGPDSVIVDGDWLANLIEQCDELAASPASADTASADTLSCDFVKEQR